jgi:hypothetical protein
MVKNTSLELLMETFLNITSGMNYIESNSGVVALLQARRMSGEMDTSLCNGFTNLMMIYFMANELAIDWRTVSCIVEGDDALIQHPTLKPKERYYSQLGFSIKLEKHAHFSHASFCGLIFDPRERINITEPIKVIANFGWVDAKYCGIKPNARLSLIRAKALSIASQYPGCPIIYPLAKKFINLTRHINVKQKHFCEDKWKANEISRAINLKIWEIEVPIGPFSRLLMSEKFNIPVPMQFILEEKIKLITDPFAPIDLPLLLDICPNSWCEYDQEYIHHLPKKNQKCWMAQNSRKINELFSKRNYLVDPTAYLSRILGLN